MMRRLLLVVVAVGMVTAAVGARQGGSNRLTADLMKGIELRSVGPTLTPGRVVDIEIDPKNASVWYVAFAFGGVWKTENRGVTFEPIFDDHHFTTGFHLVQPPLSGL